MPPRAAKKTTPGPGKKRVVEASRVAAMDEIELEVVKEAKEVEMVKAAAADEVVEELVKADDEVAVEEEEKTVESVPENETEAVERSGALDLNLIQQDEEVKEPIDEYETDERLELEDNEPEYDPEDYGGVDYGEKEMEVDNANEEEENPKKDIAGGEDMEGMHGEETDEASEECGEDKNELDCEEVDQAAGSVEEDHLDAFKERRKQKEFEVFVAGLDKDATENDLKKVFSVVGEVTEVRLMKNSTMKNTKGALLRFATVDQAKRAVSELKSPLVNGKKCGVSLSQDSDTLILRNICKRWTEEALKEKLKNYGVEDFVDMTLAEDSNKEGMNRGFAFLDFTARSDAMDAFNRLQKRDVSFGVDKPLKVSFPESCTDFGDDIMAQVKTIFVDCLPASWDEDHVRGALKKYGEIEKIELARNMPSAKRKDFGFVTFSSHDVAVNCAKDINNAEIGEGNHKAKVRARLSRPQERGRKRHVREDTRPGHSAVRSVRDLRARTAPRSIITSSANRRVESRLPPRPLKRQVEHTDRRLAMAMPSKRRRITPPSRPYDRRPPVPVYPKNNSKRDYSLQEELPPRSRSALDYSFREPLERRQTYRDSYSSRISDYPDIPRSPSRMLSRTSYIDDGYGQRFERPPTSYGEGQLHDYEPISGSKRPYATLDARYADAAGRRSRARLDYEPNPPYCGDGYSDRAVGRSGSAYGGGRTLVSSQDSRSQYSSREAMEYGRGSYGATSGSGMYSSVYGGDYMSRATELRTDRAGGGSSSYSSSLYPSRGMGGSSSYLGGGTSSRSYYRD